MSRQRNVLAGGFDINVKPSAGEGKSESKASTEDKVASLFRMLGGEGHIAVRRFRDDGSGKQEWCGSIPMSDDLQANLEETVARRFGGGDYYIMGYAKGEYVAGASLSISRDIKPVAPPRKEEERREESRQPQQPQVDMMQWMAMMDAKEERARREAAAAAQAAQAQQNNLIQVLMASQQSQTQQMMGVFGVMAAALSGGAHQPQAQSGGLGQLMEAIGAVHKVKELVGTSDGTALPPETSMAERLIGLAVTPIASKLGEAAAGMMMPKPSQPSTSPPSSTVPQSVPVVAAPANPSPPVGPRTTPPPPAPMPPRDAAPRLPPGVKPLSVEELQKRALARRAAPDLRDVEKARK